jgi:alpha-ribazole phosphatase
MVRHAPVAIKDVCYGQSEVPTSVPAWEAASAAVSGLPEIDTVWTSPSLRCRDLASAVVERDAARPGTRLYVDARLMELNFGDWEMKTFDELDRLPGGIYRSWCDDWQSAARPNGETLNALRSRVERWFRELNVLDGTQLVVTHAGVIRALRVLRDGISPETAWASPVQYLVPELLVRQ